MNHVLFVLMTMSAISVFGDEPGGSGISKCDQLRMEYGRTFVDLDMCPQTAPLNIKRILKRAELSGCKDVNAPLSGAEKGYAESIKMEQKSSYSQYGLTDQSVCDAYRVVSNKPLEQD